MGLPNDELIDLSNISLDISKLYLLTINTNNYMLMIAYSSLAFVLARGQPKWPGAEGRVSLWVPEGQYLGHTTTSNH